jgi:hypothetical protein
VRRRDVAYRQLTGRSGLIRGFRRTEVARKAEATTWSRAALLDALGQLTDHAPITETVPGSGVPLKETWIDWVSDYNIGRLKKNRPHARSTIGCNNHGGLYGLPKRPGSMLV